MKMVMCIEGKQSFLKKKDSFSSMLSSASANDASNLVGNGVKVSAIVEDHVTQMKKVYDPSNPDADDDGM